MSIGAVSGVGGGYDFPSITEMRQKMFTKMDLDGDGAISQSECETATSEMSQKTGLSITAEQMMSIMDLDQDGVITQAEQTEASGDWESYMAGLMEEAGMRAMGPPPPPPPEMSSEMSDLLDQIFTAMDTDGDGAISKTEYEAALEELGEQSDSTAAASTATGSSTSTSTTSATESTEAASSTEETSLSALLAQFLEMLGKMEEENYSQYSQESQYQGMNYYV